MRSQHHRELNQHEETNHAGTNDQVDVVELQDRLYQGVIWVTYPHQSDQQNRLSLIQRRANFVRVNPTQLRDEQGGSEEYLWFCEHCGYLGRQVGQVNAPSQNIGNVVSPETISCSVEIDTRRQSA